VITAASRADRYPVVRAPTPGQRSDGQATIVRSRNRFLSKTLGDWARFRKAREEIAIGLVSSISGRTAKWAGKLAGAYWASAFVLVWVSAPPLGQAQSVTWPSQGSARGYLHLQGYVESVPDFVGPIDGSAKLTIFTETPPTGQRRQAQQQTVQLSRSR
jgi:hypothetical protein